jgi:uncharacterized protein DUF6114
VSRLRRARRGWRSWRRSRPFWGGLLVVAGGAEIISTTLVSLSVTLRVGLGGVGGLLGTVIALVLVLCGVLLWLSAAQRAFYSIVAVVLALATFNTINLGGFLVGMLLGITGGALGFAWTLESQGPGRQPPRPSPHRLPQGAGHGSHHSGHTKRTVPGHGLVVASSVSTLTAGSARIVGLSYDGVAKVPQATGGPLRMMKFGLRSVTLTGRPTLTITERGSTAVTTTSVLSFTGHVVLYATKLSGDLLGAPLTLTPDSPESLVLRLLKPFTNHLTVTMTNVVTGHPLTLADSSQWRGFTIRVH